MYDANLVEDEGMGGGLTDPSLTDYVSVREQDSGKDDPRIQPTVVDTDDFMGAFEEGAQPTTPWDMPSPEPYTGKDAKRDMEGYASTSFLNNRPISNVGGYGRAMTIGLTGTMTPIRIAGQDWARKRIVINAITFDEPVYVSYGDSPSQQRGSSGQFVVGPHHVIMGTINGAGEAIVEHSDSVWLHCNSDVTDPLVVSYTVERYEK